MGSNTPPVSFWSITQIQRIDSTRSMGAAREPTTANLELLMKTLRVCGGIARELPSIPRVVFDHESGNQKWKSSSFTYNQFLPLGRGGGGVIEYLSLVVRCHVEG